jgi:hypothetical protein
MADAISVVFHHEDIPYIHGLGPGCIAIEVDKKHEKRARTALAQWKRAIDALNSQAEL